MLFFQLLSWAKILPWLVPGEAADARSGRTETSLSLSAHLLFSGFNIQDVGCFGEVTFPHCGTSWDWQLSNLHWGGFSWGQGCWRGAGTPLSRSVLLQGKAVLLPRAKTCLCASRAEGKKHPKVSGFLVINPAHNIIDFTVLPTLTILWWVSCDLQKCVCFVFFFFLLKFPIPQVL